MNIEGFDVAVHQCGPDELSETDFQYLPVQFDSVEWIAYWYESEPYAGDGIGIIKMKDGRFRSWSCGHCSCWGPCETQSCDEFSLDSLLADTAEHYPSLNAKIKELTGA